MMMIVMDPTSARDDLSLHNEGKKYPEIETVVCDVDDENQKSSHLTPMMNMTKRVCGGG